MATVADPDYVVSYSYDAAGNRTHTAGQYYDHDGYGIDNRETQDLWYTYDEMNRVLVSQGQRSGSTIAASVQGTELTYDLKGQRASASTYGQHTDIDETISSGHSSFQYSYVNGSFTEQYTYDGLGRLLATNQLATRTTQNYDTSVTTDGTRVVRTKSSVYDAAGRSRRTSIRTTRRSPVVIRPRRLRIWSCNRAIRCARWHRESSVMRRCGTCLQMRTV